MEVNEGHVFICGNCSILQSHWWSSAKQMSVPVFQLMVRACVPVTDESRHSPAWQTRIYGEEVSTLAIIGEGEAESRMIGREELWGCEWSLWEVLTQFYSSQVYKGGCWELYWGLILDTRYPIKPYHCSLLITIKINTFDSCAYLVFISPPVYINCFKGEHTLGVYPGWLYFWVLHVINRVFVYWLRTC